MATSTRTDVKLLGLSACPFVNRVQFALNLKSIKYELVDEPSETKSELLLQSNPIPEKTPVLFHADMTVCEPLIIVQYIDETWSEGPSILPSDTYDRATARFWAAHIDDKYWLPLLRELKTVRGDEKAKREVLDKMIEGAIILEDAFIQCSKGKAFFGGDSIGYVDICLGCMLGWLKLISIITNVKLLDEGKTPRLVEWSERFCSDEAVKGVMPETEKLLELLKAFQATQAAVCL